MTERFRITHWPGYSVPVPPVPVEPYLLDGDWLVMRALTDTAAETVNSYQDLAPELYLRDAADVDLTDPAALLDFTNTHGRFAPMHDLDSDVPLNSRVAIARHAAGHGRHHGRAAYGEVALRVHVDDISWRLRALRQLTAHAVAYRRGDYVHPVWPDHQKPGLRSLGDKEAGAWTRFTRFTNAALRPFHARVWVSVGDPDFDIGAPRPSAYEAAVLQLVNDLVDDVEYQTCPHCGRIFARQVGRSTQRSRLHGVMYCTPECARAAGVKAFRARERAKRQKEGR